jgi:hypothetical protein
MYRLPSSTRHSQLIESLTQFLTAQSAAQTKTCFCAQCGSLLRYLPTQFWLEGGEDVWNIRLPYCAHCHPLPATKETFTA